MMAHDAITPVPPYFQAALGAVDANTALARAWDVSGERPTLVLGIGKSSLELARAATRLLSSPAELTLVAAVPERLALAGAADGIGTSGRVRIFPADHPWPTERSVVAADAIRGAVVEFARVHGSSGRIVALISGGGSAHLALPDGELVLKDLVSVNMHMQRAGASIHELNAVRKHTERLKGGRLGVLSAPCDVHAFVASDVMGDPIDVIASGPFAHDPTTFQDAIRALERYGLLEALPNIAHHLREGVAGRRLETPKAGEIARIPHQVIASNAVAIEAVSKSLEGSGWKVVHTARELGPVHAAQVGEALARRAIEVAVCSRSGHGRKLALVWGGEPVVDVRPAGNRCGVGGPSQEVALAASIVLHESMEVLHRAGAAVSIATFSTDGVDGPTGAAGALVSHAQIERLPIAAAREALFRHDSHGLWTSVGGLLLTGPTGANVNHLAVVQVSDALG